MAYARYPQLRNYKKRCEIETKIETLKNQRSAYEKVIRMMAHEVNGKVEFFRGCPESWKEVSFENIRLSDGTSVSGSRINGVVKTSVH